MQPCPVKMLSPQLARRAASHLLQTIPMSDTSSKNHLEFPTGGERIAKYLARAGVCSRRDAEKLIEEGRVEVDGIRLTTPAFKVASGNVIRVNGAEVQKPEATRVWRYHKPQGLVTTAKDPEGRPTVFEKLPSDLPRVISVGRLDIASEGLLLLTNDGELARQLELPATGWLRRYRVRVRGKVHDGIISKLRSGIEVDGIKYGEINVTRDEQSSGGANQWLTIGLREGKNREIRRVLAAVDVEVSRLIRLSYGPFELADLPAGLVQEVPERVLKDQMGRGPKTEMAEDGSVKRAPRAPKPGGWAKAKPKDKLKDKARDKTKDKAGHKGRGKFKDRASERTAGKTIERAGGKSFSGKPGGRPAAAKGSSGKAGPRPSGGKPSGRKPSGGGAARPGNAGKPNANRRRNP